MTGAVQLVQVRRDRHGWPKGYFRPLVGKRIPFPMPDGSARTGVLKGVTETEEMLSFRLLGRGAGRMRVGRR